MTWLVNAKLTKQTEVINRSLLILCLSRNFNKRLERVQYYKTIFKVCCVSAVRSTSKVDVVCNSFSVSLLSRSPMHAGVAHLEGVAGKSKAKLPTDHHGLHGAPALTTHCAPHQGTVPLCQDLHPPLKRIPSSAEAELQRTWQSRKLARRPLT